MIDKYRRPDSRTAIIQQMIKSEKDRDVQNKLKLILFQIRMFKKLTPEQNDFLKIYGQNEIRAN